MENERYETVEDLIHSDSFCEWVKDQQHNEFWLEWQAGNAERKALVKEASVFVEQLSFSKKETSETEVAAAMTSLWVNIKKQQPVSGPNVNYTQKRLFTLGQRWRIAASVLFLLAASWVTWQYSLNDIITYATTYGETETLILPDGSQVVLQANSTLKVPKDWTKKSAREVWLEGQAFFDVTKLAHKTPIKFTVQTDDFKVSRSENKRVVLQEGKVRMELGDNQIIDLQPNEMITYAIQTKAYKKSAVKATNFIAWTNSKLILDNTPLSEIARILTQNYGYQVSFSKNVNQEQTRSTIGAIPIKNVEDLIMIAEATYEISISKTGKQLKIQ